MKFFNHPKIDGRQLTFRMKCRDSFENVIFLGCIIDSEKNNRFIICTYVWEEATAKELDFQYLMLRL